MKTAIALLFVPLLAVAHERCPKTEPPPRPPIVKPVNPLPPPIKPVPLKVLAPSSNGNNWFPALGIVAAGGVIGIEIKKHF